MNLIWREIGEKVASSEEVVEISSGQTLKIEGSPGGPEVLNITTPAGKVIEYYIRVTARERYA